VARLRKAVCADHAEGVDDAIEQEWQQMPAARGHGQTVAKFYYQHLSPDQGSRFVDMVNDGTLRIGLPGYFYVLPFFMTRQDPAGEGT
jgi:hypothetical protein